MHSKRTVVLIASITFIAGIFFAARLGWIGETKAKEYFHESAGAGTPIASAPGSFSPLVKKVAPAVVNIYTTKKVTMRAFNPFKTGPGRGQGDPFEDFFDKFFQGGPTGREGIQREQHSLGSGFVINGDGLILTNNHVIAGADEINVQFSDEKKYPAKVVGADEKTDVAIVKITTDKKLPFVQLGNSNNVEIGDWVVAVGNPFGLDHTVTAGIVSAKGRVIGAGPYDDFIQMDASINPGNSGGPLFDTAGNVVGINTAILAAGQGLGFAIPINMAKKLIPQLVEKGKITDRGWLGLQIQPMTEELAKSFGLEEGKGALVGDVIAGSAAERAGIKRGDVILKYNDKELNKSSELPGLVGSTPTGATIKLEVLREGKKQIMPVTLGKQQIDDIKSGKAKDEVTEFQKADAIGLVVRPLSAEEAHSLGVKQNKGMLIARVEPASAAEGSDIRAGDVLLEINGKSTNSSAEYQKAITGVKKGSIVRLLVRRDNSTVYVAFKIQ